MYVFKFDYVNITLFFVIPKHFRFIFIFFSLPHPEDGPDRGCPHFVWLDEHNLIPSEAKQNHDDPDPGLHIREE